MRKQPLIAGTIQSMYPCKNEFVGQISADGTHGLPSLHNRHDPRPELPGQCGKWFPLQGNRREMTCRTESRK